MDTNKKIKASGLLNWEWEVISDGITAWQNYNEQTFELLNPIYLIKGTKYSHTNRFPPGHETKVFEIKTSNWENLYLDVDTYDQLEWGWVDENGKDCIKKIL